MTDADEIEQLKTLIERREVLERLCRSSVRIGDLVDEVGTSRSTVNRAVGDLEALGLVERGEDGVAITTAGRLALDHLADTRSGFDDVLRAEAVVDPIPDSAPVDPAMVVGAEPVSPTESVAYRPLERLYDALADADRYRALVPTVPDPRLVQLLYERVVADGTSAELVVTEEVFETLRREFPRRAEALAQADGFSVLVGPVPPYHLAAVNRESARSNGSTVHLVVLAEHGGVHGSLVNDADAAIGWATAQFEAHRARATDRTDELIRDADSPIGREIQDGGTTGIVRTLPVSLEREGFVQLDLAYFVDEPVADPETAWRAGLSPAEVHVGYAIERHGSDGSGRDGREGDARAEAEVGERATPADDRGESNGVDREAGRRDRDSGAEGSSLAAALAADLAAGRNRILLGPAGSGKSTICKQVACRWYEAGRGPVLYREGDSGRPFESVDDLVAFASGADGHALVVVEDAVRPAANAIFEAIDRLAERTDVSVLLDARDSEWGTFSDATAGRTDLEPIHAPSFTRADCAALLDRFEKTVGRRIDVTPERLWAAVRDEAAEDAVASTELPRVIHRLSTYADPLDREATALEVAVASVYESIADDELAVSVCTLANALTVAGVGVDRATLYAVAGPASFDEVDEAIERLTGRVLFPREDGSFRTLHEEWATAFLARLLELEGEAGAAKRFGTTVSVALALADEPERRHRIERHLGEDRVRAAPLDDPASWADDVAEAIHVVARNRSQFAPLFGDGERDSIQVPAACSGAVRTQLPIWLGELFLAGGYYDRAERAFVRASAAAETAPEGSLGLARVAINRGAYDDATAACRECLMAIDGEGAGDGASAIRGRAEMALGEALSERGEYAEADSHYQVALDDFRAAGFRRGTADVNHRLGRVAYETGDYDRTREFYERSLEIRREIGDRRGEAETLNELGNVARQMSQYDRAREYGERSLEIRRVLGDRRGEAITLNSLGNVAVIAGSYERASELYGRSLEIRREIGDRAGEGDALANLGEVERLRGDTELAVECYERSLEIRREIGDRRGQVQVLNNLGIVAATRGEYDRAGDLFERIVDLHRELGNRHGEGTGLNNLGELERLRGRYDRAAELFERSLEISREIGDRRGEYTCLNNLGEVELRRGEFDRAADHLEESLDGKRSLETADDVAMVRNNLGALSLRRGSDGRAREHLDRAVEEATECDDAEQLARSLRLLAEIDIREEAYERAHDRLEEGLAAAETADSPVAQRCRLTRGSLALARGELDSAREDATAARDRFAAEGDAYWLARSDRLLGQIAANGGEYGSARDRFSDAVDDFASVGATEDALETIREVLDAGGEQTLEADVGDGATDFDLDGWYQLARGLVADASAEVADRHAEWLSTAQ